MVAAMLRKNGDGRADRVVLVGPTGVIAEYFLPSRTDFADIVAHYRETRPHVRLGFHLCDSVCIVTIGKRRDICLRNFREEC